MFSRRSAETLEAPFVVKERFLGVQGIQDFVVKYKK